MLFGGVRKQFVSVNLFNFVTVMTDVREGVLSRYEECKKLSGIAENNFVIGTNAYVTLKLTVDN